MKAGVFFLLAFVVLGARLTPAQGETGAPASSPRPEGYGLAAKYPGDIGIESNPAVIFCENFEKGKTVKDLRKGVWTNISNKDGRCMAFSSLVPPASLGRRSLEISANRGHDSGGHLYTAGLPGHDEVYARYYVRFAADAGYTHHFVSLGATSDPRPWPMGGAGIRPAGDKKVGSGLEPNGGWGRCPPPGYWTFYTYWHEMRSFNGGRSYYGNGFSPAKRQLIPRGKWICVERMTRMNSAPDKHDGVQAFWIDGELIGWWGPDGVRGKWVKDYWKAGGGQPFPGFNWRTTNKLKINKFWLSLYVSEKAFQFTDKWGAKFSDLEINSQKLTVHFDDVVLATKYIGPLAPRAVTRTARKEGYSSKRAAAAETHDPLAAHRKALEAAERLAREGRWDEAVAGYRELASALENDAAKERVNLRLKGIEALPVLIRTIVQGVEAQGPKSVYIDFAGRVERARLVRAIETEATFVIKGSQIPLSWRQVSARRLAAIAAKYAGSSTAQLAIAKFLAACGETDAARLQLDKALAANPSDTEQQTARRIRAALD